MQEKSLIAKFLKCLIVMSVHVAFEQKTFVSLYYGESILFKQKKDAVKNAMYWLKFHNNSLSAFTQEIILYY